MAKLLHFKTFSVKQSHESWGKNVKLLNLNEKSSCGEPKMAGFLMCKSLVLSFLNPYLFILFSCPESKVKEPNFTLKRTFRVENTGLLPITIRSAEINGQTCEGYGFKVLNCQEFALEPNSSKDLIIL